MNGPFDFSPAALAREAMQMQAKLGAGLGTLREVDDVTYGATEREEVWRDGKVVLYRFRGETVLVVSHGGVILALWGRIAPGSPLAPADDDDVPNCSTYVFERDADGWRVGSP